MKNQVLKSSVVIGIFIFISATLLVVSQTNKPSNSLSAPAPTPTPQRFGCTMPQTSKPPDKQTKNTPHNNNGLNAEHAIYIAKNFDWDCDGISNYDDNCRNTYNPDQKDSNNNGIGDVCETKKTSQSQKVGCSMPNADELSNKSNKNTSPKSNGRSADSVLKMAKILDWDCDGVSNHDDNCTYKYNPSQKDRNKNGIGDACEAKKRRSKKSAGKKQKFGV